jgi:hypothetical protein
MQEVTGDLVSEKEKNGEKMFIWFDDLFFDGSAVGRG